jgi:hypothetical protein
LLAVGADEANRADADVLVHPRTTVLRRQLVGVSNRETPLKDEQRRDNGHGTSRLPILAAIHSTPQPNTRVLSAARRGMLNQMCQRLRPPAHLGRCPGKRRLHERRHPEPCRQPGEHVRGNWVVDLVLRKKRLSWLRVIWVAMCCGQCLPPGPSSSLSRRLAGAVAKDVGSIARHGLVLSRCL